MAEVLKMFDCQLSIENIDGDLVLTVDPYDGDDEPIMCCFSVADARQFARRLLAHADQIDRYGANALPPPVE